ncbi:MAG: hypothetical protein KGH76_06170 [Thaumarchaeota archaeon]|nr:hypothetical protein [Nitrososphaerota archaeon]MDE1842635.1 hypothetical protein [Nitrososphaerota archaeon]
MHQNRKSQRFFSKIKTMYPAALGIEILCIMSAQIGQSVSFLLFGYHDLFGITTSYVLGYGLASFTTFCTIIGRYDTSNELDGCCSALEHDGRHGFVANLKTTFKNFREGIRKIPYLHSQKDLRHVIKTSLYVMITAESACILTAETVNLVFFRQALWLSIPISLFIAAFAIVVIEAYKQTRNTIE